MGRVIELQARPADELRWEAPLAADEGIVWHFEFGWEADVPTDPWSLSSAQRAIAHFVEEVWPVAAEKTRGVLLYRGSLPLVWSEERRELLKSWIARQMRGAVALDERFVADLWMAHFQLVSYQLPEELEVFIDIPKRSYPDPLIAAHVLRRERFAPFRFWEEGGGGVEGVLLPDEERVDEEVLGALRRVYQPQMRILEESRLSEEWEGLDRLFVPLAALSDRGRRQLKGFEAAGGEVASICIPNAS
jgi:hypothetical protein